MANVDRAKKGDICSIPVKSLVRRGDKLYKIIESTQEEY